MDLGMVLACQQWLRPAPDADYDVVGGLLCRLCLGHGDGDGIGDGAGNGAAGRQKSGPNCAPAAVALADRPTEHPVELLAGRDGRLCLRWPGLAPFELDVGAALRVAADGCHLSVALRGGVLVRMRARDGKAALLCARRLADAAQGAAAGEAAGAVGTAQELAADAAIRDVAGRGASWAEYLSLHAEMEADREWPPQRVARAAGALARARVRDADRAALAAALEAERLRVSAELAAAFDRAWPPDGRAADAAGAAAAIDGGQERAVRVMEAQLVLDELPRGYAASWDQRR